MAKCNFKIGYSQPIESLIEQARTGIAQKGGTFNGDTHSGNFTVPSPVGKIVGNYTVQGSSIDFAITDKPFIVTCNKIESALKGLIGGSNYALSFGLSSEEGVSEKGQKYEVVSEEAETETEASTEELLKAKAPFDVKVSWSVGAAGEWIETSDEIRKQTGITRYCLCKQDDPTSHYQYILYIQNTEHYCYYFYDQTDDSYKLDTFRNGQHYVRYNSKQPTIVRIKGS